MSLVFLATAEISLSGLFVWTSDNVTGTLKLLDIFIWNNAAPMSLVFRQLPQLCDWNNSSVIYLVF